MNRARLPGVPYQRWVSILLITSSPLSVQYKYFEKTFHMACVPHGCAFLERTPEFGIELG